MTVIVLHSKNWLYPNKESPIINAQRAAETSAALL